jgi:flagellar biosynthetic protein FlhB
MSLLDDNIAERTEQPTPLRLAEARRRGQVARSGDLVSALTLTAVIGALAWSVPKAATALGEMTRSALAAEGEQATALSAAGVISPDLGRALLYLLPVVLAAVAAPVLANLVQTGWVWSGEALAPKLERLSPGQGLRNIAGKRSGVRAAMALAKLAAVATIAWHALAGDWPSLLARTAGPEAIAAVVGRVLLSVAAQVTALLLALAIIDWLYQRWQHRQDLRITRRQLRDDMRQMEADPGVRRRQRGSAQRLSPVVLQARLAEAEVVVTWPGRMTAAATSGDDVARPQVLLAVSGAAARQAEAAASAWGVVVVEDRLLARALHNYKRRGGELPPALAGRMQEVLAYARAVTSSTPSRRGQREMAVTT